MWYCASWSDSTGNANVREHEAREDAVEDAERRVKLLVGASARADIPRTDEHGQTVWAIAPRVSDYYGRRYVGVWYAYDDDAGDGYYVDAATRSGMYDRW